MQTTTQRDLKIKDFDSPEPINRESRFDYNELFFSITDPKSTITYANDVFVRISKYDVDEIVGQLHKLIRHPDMPRSVFYEFWNHLKNDQPVAPRRSPGRCSGPRSPARRWGPPRARQRSGVGACRRGRCGSTGSRSVSSRRRRSSWRGWSWL